MARKSVWLVGFAQLYDHQNALVLKVTKMKRENVTLRAMK